MLKQSGIKQVVETDMTGTALWIQHLQRSAAVRIGLPVKAIGDTLAKLPALSGQKQLVDCGSGFIYTTLPKLAAAQAQPWLADVRRLTQQQGGYAVALSLPDSWRGDIDPWGYQPSTLQLMRALKARWDPAGILNPGAFIC